MVQLMVSHVAVVLLTFLLLNVIAVAVILGVLPGRSLLGFDAATQDVFLAERARAYATWLDLDEIADAHGGLDTPEAGAALTEQLQRIVTADVPGFQGTTTGNPTSFGSIAFGVPEAAVLTAPDGTVLASSRPVLGAPGMSIDAVAASPAQTAVEQLLASAGEADDPAALTYAVTLLDDVTGAAAPVFGPDGEVAGVLALQGYPLPEIFEEARAEIIRETASAVLRATWLYAIPAILVALPFAYWQARSISHRLERLADLADAFADGDLHTRVRITRRDEIGRLAERFNELGMRIEDDARTRRAFLSNVSHELRTPVAIMQGTLERIQDGKCESPRQMQQAIALLDMEARNLSRLIDDLSTLGRLEEARLRLELRALDAHAIAAEATETLRQMAWTQRKVSIENLVPPELPPIFGDAGRVRQIVHNLLFNALRHTPEGGLIVVQAGVSGEMMEIAVSDTGTGIAPEKLEQIFRRYYQVELPKRTKEGSGLGLHIVQQLVEAQGGTISVESEVGKGTTFRFTVPLAKGAAQRRADPDRV